MIVGFTITDFNGYEDEAVEFIRKVCILESPDIAENIVLAGAGSVNVFTSAVTLQDLQGQPFSCTPIETQDGKYLVASAVNFFLELTYNNAPLGLQPTEYIYVEPEELPQFYEYYQQGLELVSLLPGLGARGETQEGYADLSEDGVLQRIALRLARSRLVEGITVDFDDGQRLLRNLMVEKEVEA